MLNVELIAYFYGISLLPAIPFLIHLKGCNVHYCLIRPQILADIRRKLFS